ncbi:MAG: DUF411 domain-containing protein [Paracoccus sp. (in: a-proteobacteria)]|uniref:DUF411 domain-containing protein n=1 Tax=Paracoccus sp. TaxID=267 RepID=UPI0026DFFDAE|nr:DUF411 domain-containing protein [Paracoccus sp. (in: a-proteobacteria)]MDO5631761.1 DUF411 domain-containing protein [Paracoccus sp. (in: a-proteobacteria)]
MLTRRNLMMAGAVAVLIPAAARAQVPAVHVLKDRNCGCCGDWIAVLRRDGFHVTAEDVAPEELARFKVAGGIPAQLTSCHTARVGGYLIEGHVPPADIRRLLDQRPDAVGLAVPGMPYGSPGMGPENQREAYDVLLVRRDGQAEVFNSYPAA